MKAPVRVRQVIESLSASVSSDDCRFVRSCLTPRLVELFQRLSTSDQSHAIAVARGLQRQGVGEADILQAALLHDVGKALVRVRLWHRIAKVLAEAMAPGRDWCGPRPSAVSWHYALWVLAHHPELGADLAAAAGAGPRVVELIRWHQSGEGAPAVLRPDLERLRRLDNA